MGEVRIEPVAWEDPRAVELRHLMDLDMRERYGVGPGREPAELTAKRARALAVSRSQIRAVFLALLPDGTPIGHIALRMLGDEWEVKRLLVTPAARRTGIAQALLAEVERVAREGGAARLILQAGEKQPEAVALYRKLGWSPIPVYEPYIETMPHSLCFEKTLAG
ncbi:GNAT family N-acetyltransferase [Naasia sp. SYSU D00948]|uniref:GNAT family N-acetyltransferase n=1 Tax=Naasia sp. SYSU D00948 TaxID=2817379 RepID=UPI001B30E2A5|nr:GNAT family N-acetyltransferase [Naasia sp. SYSU D00948]